MDEPFAVGERNGLGAVMDAELRQNPLDVGRDSLRADDKAHRDRVRFEGVCQETEDRLLAVRQAE